MIKVYKAPHYQSFYFRFFKKYIWETETGLIIGNALFAFLPKLTILIFIRRKKYEQSFPK